MVRPIIYVLYVELSFLYDVKVLLLKFMLISKKSVRIKLHSTDILNPWVLKMLLILYVVVLLLHLYLFKIARQSSRYWPNDRKLFKESKIN